MKWILRYQYLWLALFCFSSFSAYGAKPRDSTDQDTLDLNPAPPNTILLKQGYFSIDSKEDGDVDLQATDEQCPKGTTMAFYYNIRDSHLNGAGKSMGYFSEFTLEKEGKGYAIKGQAYETDDDSTRPHDWAGITWQIWCSVNKDVSAEDSILSAREHP